MSKAKNYLVIESHSIDRDGNRHDFIHFIDLKDSNNLLRDVAGLFFHITYFCGKEGQKVDKVYFSESSLGAW